MPGAYRIEISGNNRAGCQSTECKNQAIKIFKGELRFGIFVNIQEHQSWKWKHWGCVTPQQIANVRDAVDGEVDKYLDGFEELDEYLQEKVRKAVEEGHVADDDWRGDVEVNREGQKGYRTSASKLKAKEAKAKEADAKLEAAEHGSDSPSARPAKKKRSRVKQEVKDEDEGDDEPAPKKAKTAPKKGKKVKAEEDSEDDPKPKKGRKKAAKPEAATRVMEGEDDEVSKESGPPRKTARASRKPAAKPVKSETTDTEDEELDESADDAGGQDDPKAAASSKVQKPKKGRKAGDKDSSNGKLATSKSRPSVKQEQPMADPAADRHKRTGGRASRSAAT